MNDREKFVVKAALIYLQANREDVNQAFETDDQVEISVNGDVGNAILEDEVEDLLFTMFWESTNLGAEGRN